MMPLGRVEDFPESILNDEDYSSRGRGLTNSRGYQTRPLSSGISRSNDSRRQGDNPFSQGTPPPSLRRDGAQGADTSSMGSNLTSLGKASTVHWPWQGATSGSDATTTTISSSKSEGMSLSHTTGSMAQPTSQQKEGRSFVYTKEGSSTK
jgi:hypothetical protein